MQNLRTSANKGSNDAYDVHTSLTQRGRPFFSRRQSRAVPSPKQRGERAALVRCSVTKFACSPIHRSCISLSCSMFLDEHLVLEHFELRPRILCSVALSWSWSTCSESAWMSERSVRAVRCAQAVRLSYCLLTPVVKVPLSCIILEQWLVRLLSRPCVVPLCSVGIGAVRVWVRALATRLCECRPAWCCFSCSPLLLRGERAGVVLVRCRDVCSHGVSRWWLSLFGGSFFPFACSVFGRPRKWVPRHLEHCVKEPIANRWTRTMATS